MKLGVTGAGGRVGRMVIRAILEQEGVNLAGACDRPEAELSGHDAGTHVGLAPSGIILSEDVDQLFNEADAVIDFTSPAASARHARIAASYGTPLVVGTTGLGEKDIAVLQEAAGKTAVLSAPNMSAGVTLLTALAEKVAGALGPHWDVDILEMHHREKVDAPSGTALGLGRAVAQGRGVSLDDKACYARHGETGRRPMGEIGFATLRGGDVVGDHSVIFATPGERIELTHRAGDREIFALGAIRAALWVKDRPPGLYSMRDVLGI